MALRTQIVDAAVQARCLRQQVFAQRRLVSSITAKPTSTPASGTTKLSNRRLISLHGPDTPKFLQGILTNNVQEDGAQPGFYSAFLNAQGKVLNDVFVFPTGGTTWQQEQFDDTDPGYLIDVDGDTSEQLLRHLKRHKLRSKFKMRLVEEGELDVWSAWKDDRWTHHTKAKSGTELSLIDCRAPGMGQRLLLKDSENIGDIAELEDGQQLPLNTYNLRRYLRGIPEGQREIPREESLPMNFNMDIMGGIDFKKGCYIGQELTIRTHHTGVVRRRVLPVQLYASRSEPPTELSYDPDVLSSTVSSGDITKVDGRNRSSGKLIASTGNIGIAMCRLEQMSDLNLSSDAQSGEDRFVVPDLAGQPLGVKAFVPDWIRNRIRDPKVQRRVE